MSRRFVAVPCPSLVFSLCGHMRHGQTRSPMVSVPFRPLADSLATAPMRVCPMAHESTGRHLARDVLMDAGPARNLGGAHDDPDSGRFTGAFQTFLGQSVPAVRWETSPLLGMDAMISSLLGVASRVEHKVSPGWASFARAGWGASMWGGGRKCRRIPPKSVGATRANNLTRVGPSISVEFPIEVGIYSPVAGNPSLELERPLRRGTGARREWNGTPGKVISGTATGA